MSDVDNFREWVGMHGAAFRTSLSQELGQDLPDDPNGLADFAIETAQSGQAGYDTVVRAIENMGDHNAKGDFVEIINAGMGIFNRIFGADPEMTAALNEANARAYQAQSKTINVIMMVMVALILGVVGFFFFRKSKG